MGCSEIDFGNPNTWGIVCNSHSRKVLKRWEQVRPYVEEKGVVYEFFASDGKEEITCVYQNDRLVNIDPAKQKSSVVNASWQDRLTLRFLSGCARRARIYNCMGELLSDRVAELKHGINEFPVPRSGLLVLE